jgi:DNA-binding NtrC family response regulator
MAERVDDIMPLVHHFLPHRELSLSAENELKSHIWQGNVRELENACKRVAVLKPTGVIEADDFAFSEQADSVLPGGAAKANVAEPTKEALESAMREHQGVIARIARHFGLSRQALYRRLDKYEIPY